MNAWKIPALRFGRTLYFLAVTASVWLVMADTALAKWKDPDAAENAVAGEKGYTLQYMLVVLCVALGMAVVCRAGRRESETKLTKQEDED